MTHPVVRGALCAALFTPVATLAANEAEIAELRAQVNQMKAQYERRIADLEARLERAERAAPQPPAARGDPAEAQPMSAPVVYAAPPAPKPGGFGTLTSGTAFNPQISVILDGNYYQDGVDGEGATLVGEAFMPGRQVHVHEEAEGSDDIHGDDHGHAHGAMENGFNFRDAEIAFSATVDPYFDAALYLAIDGDGNTELEEGYFQTRSLPYGLRVKGGKFLSDFGYVNRQHPHQWDFVDQNLPYLNLLGDHGLQDTGLQLTWLPELPVYALLGVEALQGNQEIFGATLGDAEQVELNLGDTDNGPRLWTAFAKLAPDLGPKHALQLGVSYAHASQHQEVHTHAHAAPAGGDTDQDHEHEGDHEGNPGHEDEHVHEGHDHDALVLHETGLAGDADLWGVDLVYKYDGDGAQGHRDLKFQAEYLRSIRDLSVRASAHPEQLGSTWKGTTDGLYAQVVYGFAPRWSAGVRYDVLGLTNELDAPVSEGFGSSDRWTLDITWDLTEFSRLRAQYASSNILVEPGERERFDAFYLQFIVSLGAHGAHSF
jgi:hypothetical protein